MVPDEFLPSKKLLEMWRAGLAETARYSRGQIAANAVADIPSDALLEEIANTIYGIFIAEFSFMRTTIPKVFPLFDEEGLWHGIAKRIDHCLPMCDQEAGRFIKLLEREVRVFFLSGKTWEASWGKVCVDDGSVNVHLTANVPAHN